MQLKEKRIWLYNMKTGCTREHQRQQEKLEKHFFWQNQPAVASGTELLLRDPNCLSLFSIRLSKKTISVNSGW